MASDLPAPDRRLLVVALLLGLAIATSALFTVFVPRGPVAGVGNWHYPMSIPILTLGSDLHIFLTAAEAMNYGEDPLNVNYNSPPFAAAVFTPLLFVPEASAYRVQFSLTLVENGLVLVLLVACLLRAGPADETAAGFSGRRVAVLALAAIATAAFAFFGYPLEFSVERGNYDSLALLAMCLGLWLSLRPRPGLWLPVLFFSLATHLKVYPALLLAIPLWHHRWRALALTLAVNVALLFCFGEDRAIEFLRGLYVYSLHPYLWVGNHSAVAYGTLVLAPALKSLVGTAWALPVAKTLALGVPFVLGVHGALRLFRAGQNPRNTLLFCALCIPLMNLFTSVSNDYKLVIAALPALVCLAGFAGEYVIAGGWGPLVGVLLTLLCQVQIAHTYLFPSPFFVANKYPPVLGLLILVHQLIRRTLSALRPVPRTAASLGDAPAVDLGAAGG